MQGILLNMLYYCMKNQWWINECSLSHGQFSYLKSLSDSRQYSQNFTSQKHDEQFHVSGNCFFLLLLLLLIVGIISNNS